METPPIVCVWGGGADFLVHLYLGPNTPCLATKPVQLMQTDPEVLHLPTVAVITGNTGFPKCQPSEGKTNSHHVQVGLLLFLSLPPSTPTSPTTLPPDSAGFKLCCFESHSYAPEGLLIPISDTGPQSLIIYSCPPVNNGTKQNKQTKKNDGNSSKGVGRGKVS